MTSKSEPNERVGRGGLSRRQNSFLKQALARYQERSQLTQEKLALAIGCTQPQVSRILRGGGSSLPVAQKLAERLGEATLEMLGGERSSLIRDYPGWNGIRLEVLKLDPSLAAAELDAIGAWGVTIDRLDVLFVLDLGRAHAGLRRRHG